MSPVRCALAALLLLGACCAANAATPKEIDAAIQKGAAFLKKSDGGDGNGRDADHLGGRALAGLALLETGTTPDDPAVKKITAAVRDASFTEVRTYQIALFILYLDRLGDPADRPLIQMLGVRLVAGQNAEGGWTYTCVPPVPQATERALRARLGEATLVAGGKQPVPEPKPKPGAPNVPPAAGKLHADVERYRQGLLASEAASKKRDADDNSNTQFGILGVWTARKHGVPVEPALALIEARFLVTQTAFGGWPYSGRRDGSPSMTCAGLLGLATAVGRREERVLKAEAGKAAKKPGDGDPFFNPPAPKGGAKKPPADARDLAIARGMANLAAALTGEAVGGAKGKGKGNQRGGTHDLYFLWSLERVGVIYGIEKVGRTDWYAFGAGALIPAQNANGSWGGRGGYGADVNTAFALLFLARSNLARDLSARVQRDPFGAELRAGSGPAPVDPKPAPAPMPSPVDPPVVKPELPIVPVKPEPVKPAGTTPGDIAAELFRATGANWNATLQRVRDAKGTENTSALLAVIPLLDGGRQKEARAALAERLCRMNAATLRTMLKAEDAELRRAAALACAMKDDREHIGDLIAALEDKDADVAKAARAGLKSLTGKDFATAAEWKAWHATGK